jgi:galactose mutarotase-like enzyme
MDEMEILAIENEALAVRVDPAYGARVVSLRDKVAEREWLTQGPRSPHTGEDVRYLGAEAVGWDECFPTVSPAGAVGTPWQRRLRDHGDLWGRPWVVEHAAPDAATLRYEDPLFSFSRTLTLAGDTLSADYAVENRTDVPLPYLWALHALLSVAPGDRLVIPGLTRVRATHLALGGAALPKAEMPWPETGVLPFALDQMQPPNTTFAAKCLATGMPGGKAWIGRPGAWLSLSWDRSISDLGIWLTYGGWPAPGPGSHQEVAIEPTSASADDLLQAIEAGAAPLGPAETRRWRVSFSRSASGPVGA